MCVSATGPRPGLSRVIVQIKWAVGKQAATRREISIYLEEAKFSESLLWALRTDKYDSSTFKFDLSQPQQYPQHPASHNTLLYPSLITYK
jgi:hypothetical protein